MVPGSDAFAFSSCFWRTPVQFVGEDGREHVAGAWKQQRPWISEPRRLHSIWWDIPKSRRLALLRHAASSPQLERGRTLTFLSSASVVLVRMPLQSKFEVEVFQAVSMWRAHARARLNLEADLTREYQLFCQISPEKRSKCLWYWKINVFPLRNSCISMSETPVRMLAIWNVVECDDCWQYATPVHIFQINLN